MKILKHLTANDLKIDDFPFLRELSMEAYLIENPSVLALEEDGFNYEDGPEVIADELVLPNGRISKEGDGRIDLLVKYSEAETLGIIGG